MVQPQVESNIGYEASRKDVGGSVATAKDEGTKGSFAGQTAQTVPVIPASTGGGYGGYENAPKDDINLTN